MRRPTGAELAQAADHALSLKDDVRDPVALGATIRKWLAKKENWGACFEYLKLARQKEFAIERDRERNKDYRDSEGRPISRAEAARRDVEGYLKAEGLQFDPVEWLKQVKPKLYNPAMEANVISRALSEAREEVGFKLRNLKESQRREAGEVYNAFGGAITLQHTHEATPFWERSLVNYEFRNELAYVVSCILKGNSYLLKNRRRARSETLANEELALNPA